MSLKARIVGVRLGEGASSPQKRILDFEGFPSQRIHTGEPRVRTRNVRASAVPQHLVSAPRPLSCSGWMGGE